MTRKIHVALASTMPRPGEVAENLAQIASATRQAATDGADVLLTGEMSACGYGPYPEVLATAEHAGEGPIYAALTALAQQTRLTLLAGFVEQDGAHRYISHYIVFPDGRHVVQRKNRRTKNERPLDTMCTLVYQDDADEIGQPVEEPWFTYFDIVGVRCAVAICADGGLRNLSQTLAKAGVEMLFNPAGAGGRREDRVVTDDLRTPRGRDIYIRWLEQTFMPPAQAISECLRFGRAQASVNICGYDGRKLYHMGHGTIITPMGEVPALIHGLPNLDRQRVCYTHAVVDVADRLWSPAEVLKQHDP